MQDRPVAGNDESFRNTGDTPFDPRAAVKIRADPRIRITKILKPAGGILWLVLVVDPVKRHVLFPLDPGQHRMFGAAGNAPRCKDIHDGNLTRGLQILCGQPGDPGPLDGRQLELRRRLGDQHRGDFVGVALGIETPKENPAQHKRKNDGKKGK